MALLRRCIRHEASMQGSALSFRSAQRGVVSNHKGVKLKFDDFVDRSYLNL